MIYYGRVQSTEKPEPLKIDEYSVWVHSNVDEIDDGYEYEMMQYTKNEYISKLQADVDYIAIMSGVEL